MTNKEKWLNSSNVTDEEKNKIKKLSLDESREAFEVPLTFGTAGIRRHMGVGSSLLNTQTIKMITFAWIKLLENNWKEELTKPFLVAHDTRNNGKEFAIEVAKVISGMGYKVKMMFNNNPVPTPLCSYTIRKLNLGGAACITASHNPPIYSGFKVFDVFGKHLMPNRTNTIQAELKKLDINSKIPSSTDNISYLKEDFENEFVTNVLKNIPIRDEEKNIKIVFSPLHGASYKLAPLVLRRAGFEVIEEPNESVPDGNFTFVKNPNPENVEAFTNMKILGKKVNADVLLTSDPDGDRVGVAVKKDGEYQIIGGHDIASLITNYLLLEIKAGFDRSLFSKKIIKTVVTTSLVDVIANKFNVKIVDTLTGFKYLGDAAYKMEQPPLLAVEESYGASAALNLSYDKDSVQILPILADMVNHYKKQGKSLFDVIDDLYQEYGDGYVLNYNDRESLTGPTAQDDLKRLIDNISKIEEIDGEKVKVLDYRKGIDNLDKTDLVKVYLADNKSWFAVRPSGTEPLMRKYYCIFAPNKSVAETKIKAIEKTILGAK